MIRLVFGVAVLGGLAALAAPEPKEPQWVTVRGRVVWPKDTVIPKSEVIDVTTDKAVCCKDGPLASNALTIDPKNRGVMEVIVWLRPNTEDRKDTFPKHRIHPDLAKPKPFKHVIGMPLCQFEPRVHAARAGDTLEFRNEASIPHSVNYASDEISHGLPIPADGKTWRLETPVAAHPTPITFKCDVHPWMAGRLRVFDHPYFAVTDKDGRFELPLVPKGDWRIVYWHEQGFHTGADGRLGFPLKLGGGLTVKLKDVELELPTR